MLAAEYDRHGDVARINAHAVAKIRERLGDAQARAFVACAVEHERFHRDRPSASEAQARAFVRDSCDANAERFEAVLRA